MMRELAPEVHVVERPQRFLGVELGTRMTVLRLEGGLLLHSPVNVPPELLAPLGKPRWALAPNKLHHLYIGPWIEAGLEAWAAPGLPEKRSDLRFFGVIEAGAAPFGPEVTVKPLACFPFANEVVLLHRPSRTLILTDLLFNFPPTAPWETRWVMWCAGAYPGCRASVLEQVGMRRSLAKEELGEILAWDFERIILAHGDIVTEDAKAKFRNAYRWLGL